MLETQSQQRVKNYYENRKTESSVHRSTECEWIERKGGRERVERGSAWRLQSSILKRKGERMDETGRRLVGDWRGGLFVLMGSRKVTVGDPFTQAPGLSLSFTPLASVLYSTTTSLKCSRLWSWRGENNYFSGAFPSRLTLTPGFYVIIITHCVFIITCIITCLLFYYFSILFLCIVGKGL
jgi:hypothetical protein